MISDTLERYGEISLLGLSTTASRVEAIARARSGGR
jgi:hypothetical protein